MSMYHSKKITVRFTPDEHAKILAACQNGDWISGRTPSRFIRRLVSLELRKLEAAEQVKALAEAQKPKKRPTSQDLGRRTKARSY